MIGQSIKDYWEVRGWDCSPPMAIDSKIFFPQKSTRIRVNEPLRIGGAAFGGTRVAKVELTTDQGKTWEDARIVKKMDADNVWVFWEAEIVFSSKGRYTVNVRATDIHGNSQQETDPERFDGKNDWPVLKVRVR